MLGWLAKEARIQKVVYFVGATALVVTWALGLFDVIPPNTVSKVTASVLPVMVLCIGGRVFLNLD